MTYHYTLMRVQEKKSTRYDVQIESVSGVAFTNRLVLENQIREIRAREAELESRGKLKNRWLCLKLPSDREEKKYILTISDKLCRQPGRYTKRTYLVLEPIPDFENSYRVFSAHRTLGELKGLDVPSNAITALIIHKGGSQSFIAKPIEDVDDIWDI